MDLLEIFLEIIHGGIKIAVIITAILLSMMIGVEVIKEAKLFDKIASIFQPVIKIFNLPKEAIFPLLAGFFFGIAYLVLV